MQDLRVLVTGAAGHLGSHVATMLAAEGRAVTGFDVVTPPEAAGWAFVEADVTAPETYQPLLGDADLVVHCASIHPWKPYPDALYMDINVKGTWLLYAALAEAGIGRVVMTSSIAANAMNGVPMTDWPVTEQAEYPPLDLYSYTKHAQEVTARLFAAKGTIRTLALRPPAFMPVEPLQTVLRLTGCFGLVDDIAAAHVAAVRLLADDDRASARPMFDAFYVTNDHPYTAKDVALLGGQPNPLPLVRKYWPEAAEWLVEQGYQGGWLPAFYVNEKAKQVLGWRPEFTFERCYRDYRREHG